ncbi:MAG: MOSC domain-containing protein [Hyphomicrobiales bacterium]|nr:MAG: MOSC domain-containing protein [Hyphomicrobiales bacterium]
MQVDTSEGRPEADLPRIIRLYRYPVKGLSPEALPWADLVAGGTMPADRRFAIENGPGRFDPDAPKHLPKIVFLMLMRNERLASLKTRYDDATETLTIERDGRKVAGGQLTSKLGRQLLEQFFAAYMKDDLRGPPRIVEAPGHSFSDVAAKCVHIVNLASLREVERVAGRTVDPLRFRPNVIVDGIPPWSEFKWLDSEIGLGPVRAQVWARTRRCDATNVDPATAARDMSLPALLERTWGHADFGVYASVVDGGRLSVGDALAVNA